MPTPIKVALAESATRYARKAVASYVRGDYTEFYLESGLAVEHALKSRLARENIVFIAPDKNFTAAVTLMRHEEDVSSLPNGTKTVGAQVAYSRVAELDGAMKPHRTVVEHIFSFRNGEAHLGVHGASDHRKNLIGFLNMLSALLRIPSEDFWGDHAAYVSAMIDEEAQDVDQSVQESLARAKATYEDRFGSLSSDQIRTLAITRNQALERARDDETIVGDCPACESGCLLHGENTVEVDVDYDRDGSFAGGTYYLEFRVEHLVCDACDLELEGEAELEAAGVETVIPNDDVDVDEYMREYHGDEFY